MARPVQAYLLDTNVLLRLYQPNSPEFSAIRNAVSALNRAGAELYYRSQNIVEFWNVSTRPVAQNGYGLSPAETDDVARKIERAFTLLPEVEPFIANGGGWWLHMVFREARCMMLELWRPWSSMGFITS